MSTLIRIILLIISIFLVGCSTFSGVAKFYEPWKSPESRGYHVVWLQEDQKPEIRVSNNIHRDLFETLGEHYVAIGSSLYNGPFEEIEENIRDQCKKNKATLAVYSRSYTDTRSGLSIYNGTGGTYNVQRYDFSVYYFVSFTDDVGFGVSLVDLTNEDREKFKRNTGALISVVYRKSPAFYANLIRDDIIISINGINIIDSDSAYKILAKKEINEKLVFQIIRSGSVQTIETKYSL